MKIDPFGCRIGLVILVMPRETCDWIHLIKDTLNYIKPEGFYINYK